MSVCGFNSLPDREFPNLFNAAAFSNKSLPVKDSYLLIFPEDRAEILVVCLSKSY